MNRPQSGSIRNCFADPDVGLSFGDNFEACSILSGRQGILKWPRASLVAQSMKPAERTITPRTGRAESDS